MGLTDKYRASASNKPRCYGMQYDPDDDECREECPFRTDCYDEMFLREARKPSRSSKLSRRSSTSSKPSRANTRMAMEVVDDLNVLPYPGAPWYSRLWWNSVSGALSAMGWETHTFFRHFRFPPQPKRVVVDAECCKKEDN